MLYAKKILIEYIVIKDWFWTYIVFVSTICFYSEASPYASMWGYGENLGVMFHGYTPNTWKAEAGGL